MSRLSSVFTLFVLLSADVCAVSGPLLLDDVDDVYPFVPTWQGMTVLHVGDSHVSAGLKRGLARRLKEAGAHYRPVCWVGSRAKSWVASGRLKRLIDKHRPDAIVITLGTNAMQHGRPDKYAGWVQALVRKLKGKTCYWLGPPPLLDDSHGYNEMVFENSKPCRYFDSRILNTPKRSDGKFHLTKTQGEDWAQKVWNWMNDRIDGSNIEERDAL